jgi:hypothetical protein
MPFLSRERKPDIGPVYLDVFIVPKTYDISSIWGSTKLECGTRIMELGTRIGARPLRSNIERSGNVQSRRAHHYSVFQIE